MAVQENTVTPFSPLNCFRNVALALAAAIVVLYAFGLMADNLPAIVRVILASWDAAMWALSLGGASFWFPVAGATLSAAACAWVVCVMLNSARTMLATHEQTCNNFKSLLMAVGTVGGAAYYLFFFAMRTVGDVTLFETAHQHIAFVVLHIIAIVPAGALLLLLIDVVGAAAVE